MFPPRRVDKRSVIRLKEVLHEVSLTEWYVYRKSSASPRILTSEWHCEGGFAGKREFFIDKELGRVRYITGGVLRAGLAPWGSFEFPFSVAV